MIRLIIILLSLPVIISCSSEDVKDILEEEVLPPALQTPEYEKEKYNPYGVFTGEVATGGESSGILLLIDNSPKKIHRWTVNELDVGSFKKTGSFYTSEEYAKYSVDETSVLDFTWRGGFSESNVNDNLFLTYTFENNFRNMQWEIISGQNVELKLPDTTLSSIITRQPPYPARVNIVTGQYVVQLSGALLDSYTMTIDLTSDRRVSGLDTKGCLISGSFGVGNENINLYTVSLEFENCDNSGLFEGVMTIDGATDQMANGILILASNPINAIVISASRN